MKIKKIITGGCSFTEGQTWASYLRSVVANNSCTLVNTAMSSQGQELIQKKVTLEVIESLKQYLPEELAVIVMWSGTERKALYVDNPYAIDKYFKHVWHQKNDPVKDLKNKINHDAAWFCSNANSILSPEFATEPAKMHFSLTKDSSYAVHVSLENIIFLQNFLAKNNIKYYHMFYMDYPLEDIEQYKDHGIVDYLYQQYDYSTLVDRKSIFTYLKELNNDDLYFRPDAHPTGIGQKLWLDNVLLPYLEKRIF